MWISSVDNLCVSSEYLVEKNNFDNLINKYRFIFEKNVFFVKIWDKKRKMWIESRLSTIHQIIWRNCKKEKNFTKKRNT
ncbi:hypothetical protein C2D64_08860 [Listeria ivanovii]|nr:hypothetical protein JL58_01610 [Listeria ivanovii subsp. londoniensis]MBM5720708.1 hypothetical protein [Listeria ivanovii]AIS61561.1 hypothetical protein JL53_01950 [Listeria ivanovii subsp. londoniensis]PZG33440.1 hypothetical protein C2D64_08860 [Listeria ivanovii]PZG45829.1 hypothetical protein C2D66_12085 [Listeria ivanovii]